MTNRLIEIGLNERINLEWLEHTANLVLAGHDKHLIDASLRELLKEKLSIGSHATRGSLDKTVSILKKIWVTVPGPLEELHNRGLSLFNQLPLQEHIVFHWGMSIAAYPFVGMVAGSVGRLLRLQGTASASQVQRRLKEKYGERETVSRAARHVLRNFVEWGVLLDSHNPGIYAAGRVQNVAEPKVIAWVVEAILSSNQDDALSLKMVLDSPIIFPFKLGRISSDILASYGQIQVVRHSLDEELVMLKNPRK